MIFLFSTVDAGASPLALPVTILPRLCSLLVRTFPQHVRFFGDFFYSSSLLD